MTTLRQEQLTIQLVLQQAILGDFFILFSARAYLSTSIFNLYNVSVLEKGREEVQKTVKEQRRKREARRMLKRIKLKLKSLAF